MTTVLLIRHGTHDEVGRVLSGRSEIALNERGRAQAAALTTMLAGQAIASIHASPRRRAIDTAAPLADELGLSIRVDDALDEIDFGTFTGRSFSALADVPEWRRWNAERASARCPGGETMAEAIARARVYIASIPPGGSPAVCVTHCDVIRGLVADALGLPLNRMFALACDPGSITRLALNGPDVTVLGLNLTAES